MFGKILNIIIYMIAFLTLAGSVFVFIELKSPVMAGFSLYIFISGLIGSVLLTAVAVGLGYLRKIAEKQ